MLLDFYAPQITPLITAVIMNNDAVVNSYFLMAAVMLKKLLFLRWSKLSLINGCGGRMQPLGVVDAPVTELLPPLLGLIRIAV
jgi:hypothetical protein